MLCVAWCLSAALLLFGSRLTGQIYVSPLVRIFRGDDIEVLLTRRDYYGEARFDFVEVAGDAPGQDLWIARLLCMFKVKAAARTALTTEPGWISLAMVQWMAREPRDAIAYTPTFVPSLEYPDPVVIELRSVLRLVRLLQLPRKLDDRAEDGVPRYLVLPYGKTCV